MSCAINWRTRSTADSSVNSGTRLSRLMLRCCANKWRPVRVADMLGGEQPQPAEERQRRVLQIVVHPPRGFGQGFLNDVRRIEASGQPTIEPRGDHPAEDTRDNARAAHAARRRHPGRLA